jgi:hypothetical protein
MDLTFAPGAIQTANLIDTTGAHVFNVTGWTHAGSIRSQGAPDTVNYTDTITSTDTPLVMTSKTKGGKVTSVSQSIGAVLTNDLLYSTNAMSLTLSNIGAANLTAGSGADELLDASHFSGTLSLSGSTSTTGSNHDTLVAGLGVNTLLGGAQADRFVLSGKSVSDTLSPSTEAAAGAAGQRDLIDYSAAADGVKVNLSKINVAQEMNRKAALNGEGLLTLTGFFDDLEGSRYGDILTGDHLGNVIYGGGGADTLAGGGVPKRVHGEPASRDFLDRRASPFPKIAPMAIPETIFAAVALNAAPDPYIESIFIV